MYISYMSESQKVTQVEESVSSKVVDKAEKTLQTTDALLSQTSPDLAEERLKEVVTEKIDEIRDNVEEKVDEKVDEIKELLEDKVDDLKESFEEKKEEHRPLWNAFLYLFVCIVGPSKKDKSDTKPEEEKLSN